MANSELDLVKGATVIVGNTFPEESWRGSSLTIASKGRVKCKGGKRCASDRECIGLALFVRDLKATESSGNGRVSWRHNTTKICLSHLKYANGKDIIPATTKREKKVSEPILVKKTTIPVIEEIPEEEKIVPDEKLKTDVSLAAISKAVESNDIDLLLSVIRDLKDENNCLRCRIDALQSRLIEELAG